jgi:replicative DNA helicase
MSETTEPAPQAGPPQDVEAEQSVLGAMMHGQDAITDVVEVLKPQDYYLPKHRLIHGAVVDLYGRGEPVDPITVADHLAKRGELDRAGGRSYLHTLAASVVGLSANAGYHAEIVHEKARSRGLLQAYSRGAGAAQEGELTATEIVAWVDADLAAILDGDAGTAQWFGEGHDAFLDELDDFQKNGSQQGVMTGFKDLDSLTGGLQPGQLVTVAARPAMGKSVLALDIARYAAGHDKVPTAFFSLEMNERELRQRMTAAVAKVALHHIKTQGAMTGGTDEAWTRIAKSDGFLREMRLRIHAGRPWTVSQIHAECRAMKRRDGLGLVVIDYLQLVDPGQQRGQNRQEQVAQMSRQLKMMAGSLDVPVVILAQLNRGPEQRTDKRPVPSDLRESGAVEQDSDVIILLHREDAYEKESPRAGEADLIVAKHRNGPTATITVAFQGHYSRFVDMAQS